MFLKLRNKTVLSHLLIAYLVLIILLTFFWLIRGSFWTTYDYSITDRFYQFWTSGNHPIPVNDKIVLLNISDKTYNFWKKNVLDRSDLAGLTEVLTGLESKAVFYDVIFPRPSNPVSDKKFAEAISENGSVYLPVGFDLDNQFRFFHWDSSSTLARLKSSIKNYPATTGSGSPYQAIWGLYQYDLFSEQIAGTGHISAPADPDGVYRHYAMVVRLDNYFVPTITLQMMLDYLEVSFSEVRINWGKEILIPNGESGRDSSFIRIPVNEKGETVIPFPSLWKNMPKMMEAQTLITRYQDENIRGNLEDYFSDSFVFIGDISVGISDLGKTPVEDNIPLVFIHAALMNAMLNSVFIDEMDFGHALMVFFIISILFLVSCLFKNQWVLYLGSIFVYLILFGFAWFEFQNFTWIPVFSLSASLMVLSLSLLITLQVSTHQDQAFIRNAFSKYVPDTVVDELIEKPDLLKLGGAEQELTILFSDLAGFTSISEKVPPATLVSLLNEYLTAMTGIILAEGGIIDKYLGDAIMAEFGAPIPTDDHADRALTAALKMQHRMEILNAGWAARKFPALSCRIGINTGRVVVGNMGSDQVFDYTVIGDDVNLASRLESANKRYRTNLMISERTYSLLDKNRYKIRLLDYIKVKGKENAVRVYHVFGFSEAIIFPEIQKFYELYGQAMQEYLEGRFQEAENSLSLAVQLVPDDPGANYLKQRILLAGENRSDTWDGSISLDEK